MGSAKRERVQHGSPTIATERAGPVADRLSIGKYRDGNQVSEGSSISTVVARWKKRNKSLSGVGGCDCGSSQHHCSVVRSRGSLT